MSCPKSVGGLHIYRFRDGKFRCQCGKTQEYDDMTKEWKQ